MAEVEELRVQPQDILAEQSVLGAILFLYENILSLGTFLSMHIV